MGKGKLPGWLSAVLPAILTAGAITAAFGAGLIANADHLLSDALYQKAYPRSGSVLILQIDQRAVKTLGPYDKWGRGVMADVVNTLNQSEDCHPAVIGLDILYSGESDDAEGDDALAEAAAKYGNVVAASAASFGYSLEPDDAAGMRLDKNAVVGYEEPYPALAEAAAVGQINIMLDSDGILRHHLLTIALPDGTVIPSLALAIAEKYADAAGLGEVKLPETDSRGFWYLPYSAKPGSYGEGVSVADILDGSVPPAYFKNKIVLIGPYAPAFQDSSLTSIDHAAPMYGVEFQANAVEALLREAYAKEVPDGLQLALLFLVSAAVFIACWKKPVKVSTVVTAFVCVWWIALCRFAYGEGLILHALWVSASAVVIDIGCVAAGYVRTASEKRELRATFGRYVAPEIVGEILKEGTQSLSLGGKLTDIAVLFVDVRGFTTMSEALDPETVVSILNRYLTLVSDCILRHGGTLDKFVGDAAMAFWGAPLPQEDYLMRAVQAAVDMVEGSQALSAELEKTYGRTVSFGVGVHVGEAVVGNVGSPKRMDYTAIGDTVNTAARLEANAPGGTIYISREVADRLQGRIRAKSLGDSVKLKGKADGFEVLVLEEVLDA